MIGHVTFVSQLNTDLYLQVWSCRMSTSRRSTRCRPPPRPLAGAVVTDLALAAMSCAALLQVTLVPSTSPAARRRPCSRCSRSPCSAAPSRGAGFFGGLLIDIVTLDTLGFTSLLLTLAGYWTGRYGETTGRDRAHAPLLAILVFTVALAFAGFGLHFLLGEEVSARRALFETLLPTVVLNLILGGAVFSLVRAVLRRSTPSDRVTEVRLLGSLVRTARPRGDSCRPTRGPQSRTVSRRRLALRLGVLAASLALRHPLPPPLGARGPRVTAT
jgi:rod shape-determining protein MreD